MGRVGLQGPNVVLLGPVEVLADSLREEGVVAQGEEVRFSNLNRLKIGGIGKLSVRLGGSMAAQS